MLIFINKLKNNSDCFEFKQINKNMENKQRKI